MVDAPPDAAPLCTRAVTGPDRPAHQPIFACETCRLLPDEGGVPGDDGGDGDGCDEAGEAEPLPACICQSCASSCHDGHDVCFVGVGPCTCDCPSMVVSEPGEGGAKRHECKLAEPSAKEAHNLGFVKGRALNVPLQRRVPPILATTNANEDGEEEEEDDGESNASEGALSKWMAGLCLDCHSSLGGYVYHSFTLPALAHDEGSACCQSLIRQAEALTERSHDTFWVPDDADGDDADEPVDGKWCELEALARQIYRRHVQSYPLEPTPTNDDAGENEGGNSRGGAEWWVQAKPPGTARAPVDLHYDKDEVLAEKFGLGSFPTLSTVTYLTGAEDNQPTVVFPHAYHDEEERVIEAMLLSRAAKGKHLVFDGRLLHGAPGHPALRTSVGGRDGAEMSAGQDDERERTLRVTFLVNVWRSGRPAGVDVLPESIRADVRAAAGEAGGLRKAMPLDFRERKASNRPVRGNNGEGGKIVLPFVSHGATWIDGDENRAEGEGSDGSDGAEAPSGVVDDGGNDGEEEEEDSEDEDDELVLVLPPLDMANDTEDEADTLILTFEDGNGARLVREGALEGADAPDCPWKKLAAGNETDVSANGERNTTADEFLAHLNENVPSFVASIVAELERQYGVDVSDLEADHVCYRTESIERYNSLVDALKSAGAGSAALLVESNIGGRPLATFKLATPIAIDARNGPRTIDVVEIPSPKEGSPYGAGLEHVEFVIGDGSRQSPMNGNIHEKALTAWMERHPSVPWSAKALDKDCNPDVSLKLEVGDCGKASVKFHLVPLEDVIKFETEGTISLVNCNRSPMIEVANA